MHDQGIFLTDLNIANVVNQTGSKDNANNYRPISILPRILKISTAKQVQQNSRISLHVNLVMMEICL